MTIRKETHSGTQNRKYNKAHMQTSNRGADALLTALAVLMLGSVVLAFSCAPASPAIVPGGGGGSSAPRAPSGVVIDDTSVDSTSFLLQWVAPTSTGTKEDGSALSPDEISYRVYYLAETAGQTTGQTTGQTKPSAESLVQNADTKTKEVTGGATRTTITELTPDTRYFVTVASYNSFATQPVAETVLTEVVEVSTSSAPTLNFEGSLAYAPTTYNFTAGFENTIRFESAPMIPNADTSGARIRYSLARSSGTEFDSVLVIAEDSGIITVNPTSTMGTAIYTVRAEADGYKAQEATLTIAIVENANAGGIQVSTYYSKVGEMTDVIPVMLGQAVVDDGMFSLANDDVILTLSNLTNGDYTIYFGSRVGNYDGRNYQKTVSSNSTTILKSELTANSFSFTDGAVIGMSGPGITGTWPVATYRPSNIYGSRDLQSMRKDLSLNYVLQRDIAFSSMTDSAGTVVSNYEAVGDEDNPFTGSLDGANGSNSNYSISGIQIEGTDTDNNQGLFGVMEASTVDTMAAQNLVLRDFKIKGNAIVGSLAGWVKKGTVNNVHVEVSDADAGKVEVGDGIDMGFYHYGYGGGLLGRAGTGATGTQVKIQNTSSAIVVFSGADSSRIGGLIGEAESDVMLTESFATGSTTGAGSVGGLVGYSEGIARDSYATGSVMGNNIDVGGLMGCNQGTVTDSYATGSVTGTNNNVGGLVGYSSGTVTGSYATGSVTGTGRNVGGLIGGSNGPTTGNYATGPVTGSSSVGGLVGSSEGTVIGYATGSVTGTGDEIGGLVGSGRSTVTGYATGPVTGAGNVGGLVGNNGSTVTGYAEGNVTGTGDNVGGLVGINYNIVLGYATGDVTGNEKVGGLIGVSFRFMLGYARGDVTGNDRVGGLVGDNARGGNSGAGSVVGGYARGVVRRASGTSLAFGTVIGFDDNGMVGLYSSGSESQIYDGTTGTTALASTTGLGGSSVTVDSTTPQSAFSRLRFDTAVGDWTWFAGKWPAFNIGIVRPAADQPINP